MLPHWILSLLIWLPIVGGLVVLATGQNDERPEAARWVALIFSLLTLALCVPLLLMFNADTWHFQFVENYSWIPSLNIHYALGIDGISLLFIVLNCFTTLIVILAAWRSVSTKIAQYMAIFLVAGGIMNGAFASLDSILFYVFFEASLIPMYLGIGIWGGKKKAYAAMKMFLYTFLGSIFMLVAFIYMYTKCGSFDIASFQNLQLTATEQDWIFLAFLAAFSVKIPMWPFHTWLPDVHTEAPIGGSVVLAALMLKLGAYGFVRFSLPIVPGVHHAFDWLLIILSLIAIVYVAFASIVQKDMKRLVAYSSISHMGLVTLGIFMVFIIVGQTHDVADAMISVQGSVFQMIAHAFSSGALFLGVGYLDKRYGSLWIKDYQGIAHAMPILASFFMLFAMANVGLPGTTGFVGEFLIIISAFKANIWVALIASFTLVLAPAYTLWFYKRVLFGEVKNQVIMKQKDITGMGILVMVLLAIPVIIFGVYPEPILHLAHATTLHFVDHAMLSLPVGSY